MDSFNLIQAQYLSDCVGKREYRAWSRLLPALGPADGNGKNYYYHLPQGSLLLEKSKGKSIRDQPWQKPGRFWTERQVLALRVVLTKDFGLSPRIAMTILSKERSWLLRIEDFINGVVDSLWLCDERVFIVGSPECLLIKKLIRKIFKVGAYNLKVLVDDWKQFGVCLLQTVSQAQLIGPKVALGYNNIFKLLTGIPYINRLYRGESDMLLLQHLSHLSSSRQMPFMGKKTEDQALEKYKNVLTSSFVPDEEVINDLVQAARRIGGICRNIHPQPLPDQMAHISVTSSGELEYPSAKGAQAAAVKEALSRVLGAVPSATFEEETPFGVANHIEGIPLWKTLFRDKDEVEGLSDHFLFETVTQGFPKDQFGRFYGLDNLTGKQLLYTAWKESTPNPIVLRAEIVPEMGNKARFVTLSPYWVNVLQAPLAHLLVEAMKFHPSVFSSFHRQDQAWEAVKGLVKIEDVSLEDDQYVLSSDLTDATNAQHFEVTKRILKAFIDGFGFGNHSQYIDLVLSQIGPRLVLFNDMTSVISRTGIMMGEAIAKPSLTLLNLAVEELAYLKHCRAEDTLYGSGPAPKRGWRYIHIGGDDHLAKGPISYLDLITKIHQRVGSHISPEKHIVSKVCVKYCERILNLRNLKYREPFCKADYQLSTIVDSVKVRLLERGQSTLIKKDNKNVAIGKSSQLAGCLEWLPNDDRYWRYDKKVSIRDLFIRRMGALLPSKAAHPRAYAAIHLPTAVGGYGLGLKREYKTMLFKSPEPTQWLFAKALLGLNVKEDLRIFRRLNTNVTMRGVECIQKLSETIIGQLSDYPGMINAIGWKELVTRFPAADENSRRTIAMASEAGFLSIENFAKRAVRGNLFQHLLLGGDSIKEFNTRPFTRTYNHVWTVCEERMLDHYDLDPSVTNDQLIKIINDIAPEWYFDINQTTTTDVGPFCEVGDPLEEYDFRDTTYIKKYTEGFPNLIVGKAFLGIIA
jgi:hypothetical protein